MVPEKAGTVYEENKEFKLADQKPEALSDKVEKMQGLFDDAQRRGIGVRFEHQAQVKKRKQAFEQVQTARVNYEQAKIGFDNKRIDEGYQNFKEQLKQKKQTLDAAQIRFNTAKAKFIASFAHRLA